MAEQLALEEVLRKCATIDGDEVPALAVGTAMDEPSDSFLARATFPCEKNGGIDLRHPLGEGDHPAHRMALDYEVVALFLRAVPLHLQTSRVLQKRLHCIPFWKLRCSAADRSNKADPSANPLIF